MIRDIAARRYGEAAYEIAREAGSEERWTEGLALMAAVFSDPQIDALMQEARISTADKMRLAESSLKDVDPLVLNLARLLVHRGRTSLAPQIAEAFQELVDAERGIAHAVVTTAVPLSEGEREAVAKRLGEIAGREVLVETEVDEGIIGGLIARIGDKLIDGSTRSQLAALGSAVDSFSDDELEQGGVVEGWTGKDLLGHIAFWAEKAAADLQHIAAGRPQDVEVPGSESAVDDWNARERKAREGRALQDVREEWLQSFEGAMQALADFPAERLEEKVKGATVLARFAGDTYEHYREHLGHLHAWRRQLETTET